MLRSLLYIGTRMSYYLLGQPLSYLAKRYFGNSLHFISTIPTNLRFFFFFLLGFLLPFIFNVTILTKKKKKYEDRNMTNRYYSIIRVICYVVISICKVLVDR